MVRRKGFTLVELIIAMAVTVIVLTMVVTFISTFLNINRQQNEYVKAQDSLRLAGIRIEKDIRESSQNITVSRDLNGCYRITDTGDSGSVKTYCLVEKNLNRNSVYLVGNIDSISVELSSSSGTYVIIKITGSYEGRSLNYEQKIYLRSAT